MKGKEEGSFLFSNSVPSLFILTVNFPCHDGFLLFAFVSVVNIASDPPRLGDAMFPIVSLHSRGLLTLSKLLQEALTACVYFPFQR